MSHPGRPANQDTLIEQYKAYAAALGNIGSRHETSRGFYLSVTSALAVFLSLGGKDGILSGVHGRLVLLIAVVAIGVCVLWSSHMKSFGALYRAKFHVLREMDARLAFPVFQEEWNQLSDDKSYKFFTRLDSLMPWLFLAVFVGLALIKE